MYTKFMANMLPTRPPSVTVPVVWVTGTLSCLSPQLRVHF